MGGCLMFVVNEGIGYDLIDINHSNISYNDDNSISLTLPDCEKKIIITVNENETVASLGEGGAVLLIPDEMKKINNLDNLKRYLSEEKIKIPIQSPIAGSNWLVHICCIYSRNSISPGLKFS